MNIRKWNQKIRKEREQGREEETIKGRNEEEKKKEKKKIRRK